MAIVMKVQVFDGFEVLLSVHPLSIPMDENKMCLVVELDFAYNDPCIDLPLEFCRSVYCAASCT